jgi:hypothetical protein
MKLLGVERSIVGGFARIEDKRGDFMVVLGPKGGALLCLGCTVEKVRCRHVGFVRKLRRVGKLK